MLIQLIKDLKPDQKKLLNYAFENELSEIIMLSETHFLGVNAHRIPKVQIIESKGAWSYGTIQR